MPTEKNTHCSDRGDMIAPRSEPAEAPQCLQLREIQALIFTFLTRQDCLNIAKTCTTFYEQAMDVVWAEIDDLVPFILCMPSETLSIQTSYMLFTPPSLTRRTVEIHFAREPGRSDWHHFCKHTHRVKQYTDKMNATLLKPIIPNYEITPDTKQTVIDFILSLGVQDGRQQCLFPVLRTLNFYADFISSRKSPSYLAHICGSTLQYMTLDLSFYVSSKDNTREFSNLCMEWSQFMHMTCPAWPNLISISFHWRNKSGVAKVPVSPTAGWLSNLSVLRKLDVVGIVSPSFIQELSILPCLHTLILSYTEDTAILSEFPQLSSTCFPCLNTLHFELSGDRLGFAKQLFHALSNSHTLTEVRISSHAVMDPLDYGIQLQPVFEAISDIAFITTLHISLQVHFSIDDVYAVFRKELLSTLFPLRHMRDFQIVGKFAYTDISDTELRLAAVAWPSLKVFVLSPQDASDAKARAPWTTLAGVQALYNGCPCLKKVHMAVNRFSPYDDDMHGAFLDTAIPDDEIREQPMEYINLQIDDSKLKSRYLALAICLMFPVLEKFTAYPKKNHPVTWSSMEVKQHWERYRKLERSQLRELLDRTDPYEDLDEEEPGLEGSIPEPGKVSSVDESAEVEESSFESGESGSESERSDVEDGIE